MLDVRFLLQGADDEGAVPGAGVLLVAGHDTYRAVGVQKRDLLRFYYRGLGTLLFPCHPIIEVDGAGSGAVAFLQCSRHRYGHVARLRRLLGERLAKMHGDGVGGVLGVFRAGIVGSYESRLDAALKLADVEADKTAVAFSDMGREHR